VRTRKGKDKEKGAGSGFQGKFRKEKDVKEVLQDRRELVPVEREKGNLEVKGEGLMKGVPF